MKASICLAIVFIFLSNHLIAKEYTREFDNGNLIAEGWMSYGKKHGYWKFYDNNKKIAEGRFDFNRKSNYWYYYKNNQVESEGFYKNDLKANWWTYHWTSGYKKIKKQYERDELTGYVLYYRKAYLTMVEEYDMNRRLGSWNNYQSFKKDHPDFSLSNLDNYDY